jgi:outer membrane protein assembly factor BamB
MASEVIPAAVPEQPRSDETRPPAVARVWPAVMLVVLYWAAFAAIHYLEMSIFARFLLTLASQGLLIIAFTTWWLTNGRIRLAHRLAAFGAAVLGGLVAGWLCDASLGVFGMLLLALPYVFTAWTLWLLLARALSPRPRLLGLVAVLLLAWAPFTLLGMDGLDGDVQGAFRWRWSPTAEQLYQQDLSRRPREEKEPAGVTPKSLALQPGDWPAFRGDRRDGVVRGVRIATDWEKSEPRQVWRQRVGPAWSGVAVVGDRLFTQEQRGDAEAVVCLDAATGREVWVHLDAARHWDSQSGAGPRATPAFADGLLFTLGGKGTLNCLDAATGERKWSHDVGAESGARASQWGFCSSPLVVRGVVIVFAGGDGQKNLLAYRAQGGELAWTAVAGATAFSSPHPATLAGTEQVLMWSDHGLTAVDPGSGAVLWQHGGNAAGAPRSVQPLPVGDGQVLVASETDLGTALLDVTHDKATWTASQRWASRDLKPSYNNFVVHDGAVYGFDGSFFCCIDLETGKGRWKEGRYGHGQVLLLAEQGLLLVVSEKGEAILLAANPEEHEEIGRFQALKGKTWNHPALVRGRLYVRNAEEIACYDLSGK